MEAVPKLPMLYCELKISPVCPDFDTPFKNFISKHYSEDGNSYDREIRELESLRNKACRAPRDFTGCSLLKRYFSQIYSLQNRFSVFDSNVGVECVWADIYSGQTVIGDLDFELACVLYNIGALHAELGALDLRNSADSMKVACTHFQCAVWAFQHLRDDNRLYKSKDMSHEMLSFFVQVMLSQAQECILEKSMLDNRKSSIVAKVAAQVVEYYSSSLLMLLQSAINTTSNHTIVDIVGSKLYKQWKKFIEFKVAYYNSICALFMGNLAEEQQKMGERVAWYESAEVKLNEAYKLAKNTERQEVTEAMLFVSDVINVKLGNAKKENDFVYHEKVPPIDKLTEVKGVSLVKGISFSVCDPEVSGPDIFARLVPMEAHETASIYSAKKDEIMRTIRFKIEDKNQELAGYMSSLQLDRDSLRTKVEPIPDELIEVCAAMSVNPNSIDEVNQVLSELEEISDEVDKAIKDTKNMLEEEERKEKEHQEVYGKRPTSMIVCELSKELAKHEETHKKAMLSNSSLRDNLDRHCDDVKLLISSSAKDVASLLPSVGSNVPIDESNIKDMEKLLEKVEEMKNQRFMLENQLKDTMASDDVMKQVLAHTRKEIEEVFEKEIKKYDKITSILEQNLSAQENILRALTKANAKYSETRRAIAENERNRKARIASLIHTYEVFKELQTNSKKGFEFYQKFQNIVIRLQARTRGVCRVQDEERAQISLAHKRKNPGYLPDKNMAINGETSATPKLKDYLTYMTASKPVPTPPELPAGPIPAANLLSNNSINILPPAQNYPPSSLSHSSYQYERPATDQQFANQVSVPQQYPLSSAQQSQPPVPHYTQATAHSYTPPVPQYQPIVSQTQPIIPNNHFTRPETQHYGSAQNYNHLQPQPEPQLPAPPQPHPQPQYQAPAQPQPPPHPQPAPSAHHQPPPPPQQYSQAMSTLPQTYSSMATQPIPVSSPHPQPLASQQYQYPEQSQAQYQHQYTQQYPQTTHTYSQPNPSYDQQYSQSYGQQMPPQSQFQSQQSYQQTYNGMNGHQYDPQYQIPVHSVPQYVPQMSQTMAPSHPMAQTIPQSMSYSIPQSMPQTLQPIPEPIQPMQSTAQKPIEAKSQSVVADIDKPKSDLLEQFDPLYDLNGLKI